MECWIFVLVQNGSNAKKKDSAARNFKRLDQAYHSQQEKQKRKSEFFIYRDNFVLP
jgi:hypothetical protein